MVIIGTLLTFILGMAVGSFVNVASLRLPRGRSLGGRSACPKCNHQLTGLDLIPVVSFLALGGKCRYCRKKISSQYPLVEIATGLLVVLLTLPVVSSLAYLYFLFLAGALMTLLVADLRFGILPDQVTFTAIGATLLYRLGALVYNVSSLYVRLREDTEGLGQYLLKTDYLRNFAFREIKGNLWILGGAVGLALVFYLLVLATKGRGMGEGDVKLGILVGLVAGWPGVLVAAFVSFLLGAIVSAGLLLIKVKKFGETIPFGPFLIVGTVVGLWWGDEVISWYLNLL